MKHVAGTEPAGEMAVLPGMVQMIDRLPVAVADPFTVAVDVRSSGMSGSVAIIGLRNRMSVMRPGALGLRRGLLRPLSSMRYRMPAGLFPLGRCALRGLVGSGLGLVSSGLFLRCSGRMRGPCWPMRWNISPAHVSAALRRGRMLIFMLLVFMLLVFVLLGFGGWIRQAKQARQPG